MDWLLLAWSWLWFAAGAIVCGAYVFVLAGFGCYCLFGLLLIVLVR